MNYFGIIGILIGSTCFALSLFVYSQDKSNRINQLWGLFTLSVSTWGFSTFAITIAQTPVTALTLWRLALAGVIFIPITYTLFTNTFLKINNRTATKISAILTVVFLIFDSTDYFLHDTQYLFNSIYWNKPGFIYDLFVVYFIISISYAIYLYFREYKKSTDPTKKQQIIFVGAASLIGFLGGITSYLPTFGITGSYPYFNATILIFIVIVTYSIIKHHLFNIKLISAQIVTCTLWIFVLIRIFLSETGREILIESLLLFVLIFFGTMLIRSILKETRHKDALRILNLTLEQKVAEQTVEIRRSYEAEKRARIDLEKLNDAKDQFIMITQHHLRMPTQAITQSLESMTHNKDDHSITQTTLLAQARAGAERLMGIVNDFLSITTIKSGSSILNISERDLKPAIVDILDELRSEIQKKELHIEYPLQQDAWPAIPVDFTKIKESLLIVLENAVRYNITKGSINIKTSRDEKYFILTIENTGIGISKEDKDHIGSSLFYRGHDAKQAHPIGMGVGLSVVKSMIKAHKGTFTIESKGVGKGAVVTIKLPITKSA